MDFDGVNDYVDFGNDSVLDFGTTSFSISFWIKTTDSSGAVLAKGSVSGQSKAGYKFEMAATNKIQIWNVNQSVVTTYLTSTVIVSDGAWHHIVASYDRGAANLLSLYIDGSLDVTKDITSMGDLSNIYNLFLGKQDNGAYWDGGLDEVSVFNSTLDASTITSIYNSGEPTDLSAFSKMSLNFDGVDDTIDVGTTSLGITTAISVSAWVKIPTTDTGGGGTNIRMIVCEDTTSGGQRDWLLYWRGTGYDYFQGSTFHTDGSSSAVNSTGITPNDGNWHHLLLSFDGTTDANGLKMYVDGTLFQATAGSTGIFSYSGTEPAIGSLTSGGGWFFEGNLLT